MRELFSHHSSVVGAYKKPEKKVEMIREISKCEEKLFTCPYCHGKGFVRGWSPNPKGSIEYPVSKHECSRCRGTGKLKSIVEAKLKIRIMKLYPIPLFVIYEKVYLFHKEGGPASVEIVTKFNLGQIDIEKSDNFGKMSSVLNKKRISRKYLKFAIQKNVEPRIGFDILLSEPDVKW